MAVAETLTIRTVSTVVCAEINTLVNEAEAALFVNAETTALCSAEVKEADLWIVYVNTLVEGIAGASARTGREELTEFDTKAIVDWNAGSFKISFWVAKKSAFVVEAEGLTLIVNTRFVPTRLWAEIKTPDKLDEKVVANTLTTALLSFAFNKVVRSILYVR